MNVYVSLDHRSDDDDDDANRMFVNITFSHRCTKEFHVDVYILGA